MSGGGGNQNIAGYSSTGDPVYKYLNQDQVMQSVGLPGLSNNVLGKWLGSVLSRGMEFPTIQQTQAQTQAYTPQISNFNPLKYQNKAREISGLLDLSKGVKK